MSIMQKFLKRLLPAKQFAQIESESRQWQLECPACRHVISVWELGGIRYGAASRGKQMWLKCQNCHEQHWMPVERHSD